MKTSDLRKIVQEEIQKVLKEDFDPPRGGMPGRDREIYHPKRHQIKSSDQQLELLIGFDFIVLKQFHKEIMIEKSKFKNIVKEILNYIKNESPEMLNSEIKETTGQSDKVHKDFPDVINYDRQKKMSDLVWTVTTTDIWKYDRAQAFQEAMGYSSMGYGGPYDFRMLKQEGDKFIYTWHCAASS